MKAQLQQLRKSKGLTQEEIANILDVKLSTYQKYERDAISPPYDTLIKIANFYGVTTDYLLGREPAQPNPFESLGLDKESEQKLLAQYVTLPENVRAILMDTIVQLAQAIKPDAPSPIRQSTMVAVETVGEFRERQRREAEATQEAQRKETA